MSLAGSLNVSEATPDRSGQFGAGKAGGAIRSVTSVLGEQLEVPSTVR